MAWMIATVLWMVGINGPVISGCMTEVEAADAAAVRDEPVWLTREVLFYQVRYTEADAGQMERVASVLTTFHDDFVKLAGMGAGPGAGDANGASDGVESFKASHVEVMLYPPGSSEVQLGFVSMFGGPATAGGRLHYQGVLKMPGPAAYDGKQTSSTGHAMDRDYFDKLLIHEVMPVYLELYARSHGANFHASPAWFEQGTEEYFAVFHSTPYWRAGGLRFYEQTFREHRGIDTDFGINVQDAYNDGLMMMRFIAETYGEKAILATIASKEPTFGKRLHAGVGVEYREFEKKLGEWVGGMERGQRGGP